MVVLKKNTGIKNNNCHQTFEIFLGKIQIKNKIKLQKI